MSLWLGLDVSSVSTGWSILETGRDSVGLADYGLITNSDKECLGSKLDHFAAQLHEVLVKYSDVQWIGIEDTYEQNVVTMKVLSKFAGAATLTIYRALGIGTAYTEDALTKAFSKKRTPPPTHGIYLPAPLTVTRLVGIKGKLHRDEKKAAVVRWVNMYFHKKFVIDDNDITDAIAVGCATIFRIKNWTF